MLSHISGVFLPRTRIFAIYLKLTLRLDQHLSTATVQEISQLLDLNDKSTEEERPPHVDRHLRIYYYVFDAHSPYAEVRESVRNTDDPTLPVETFRAYFVGLALTGIFACVNQVQPLLFLLHTLTGLVP
jgi:hypothetical protein